MPLISISRIITPLAEQAPHRAAVTCQDKTITRQELDTHTNRSARPWYKKKTVAQESFFHWVNRRWTMHKTQIEPKINTEDQR
jgi:acyl-CoA synthetase (AMP-forming)/AMP-acid ligase II